MATLPTALAVLALPRRGVRGDLAKVYDDRLNKKCSICNRWFLCDEARVQQLDKSFCHTSCMQVQERALYDPGQQGGLIPIFLSWEDICRLEKEQEAFFAQRPTNPIYSHLMAACEAGEYDMVVWLVEIKGKDVNEHSYDEGFTPLMATCEGAKQYYNTSTIEQYVSIFHFLIRKGANIHASTRDEGWTAHMSAKGVREIQELFRGKNV